MENNRIILERRLYPEFSKEFRATLTQDDHDGLSKFFEVLIRKGDSAETISKIKSLKEFSENSFFINLMKMDWWEGFLRGNMHQTPEGKIQLTDLEGNILEFETIKDVYESFIALKNETIWEPYHNVFTKIFTEWIVELIIKACKNLPLRQRLEFINSSIGEIEKEQIVEQYTRNELNEHLHYYKAILELSLKDNSVPKGIHQNAKVFAGLMTESRINQLTDSLFLADFETFFKIMKTVYASIPYQIFRKEEAFFHSIFHVVLYLISAGTRAEEQTNKGRIDSITETGDIICIFEFKLNSAEDALNQIKKKKYYQKYYYTGKQIFIIGVAFDSSEKNIKEWRIEKISM